MNIIKSITTAPSISAAANLLPAYKSYMDNTAVTIDDLYKFLTLPTPERDDFLLLHGSLNITLIDNIVVSNYTEK